MSNIQIFSNPDFGDMRTVLINGEPWFVSADISKSLGYAKTDSMTRLVDEDDKKNISSADLGEQVYKQNYTIGVINESGLYAAIFGSKQENAKKFKKWVTSEILPEIRKTGIYVVSKIPKDPMQLLELHYQALKQIDSKLNTLEQKFDNFEKSLPLLPNEADEVSYPTPVKNRMVEILPFLFLPIDIL